MRSAYTREESLAPCSAKSRDRHPLSCVGSNRKESPWTPSRSASSWPSGGRYGPHRRSTGVYIGCGMPSVGPSGKGLAGASSGARSLSLHRQVRVVPPPFPGGIAPVLEVVPVAAGQVLLGALHPLPGLFLGPFPEAPAGSAPEDASGTLPGRFRERLGALKRPSLRTLPAFPERRSQHLPGRTSGAVAQERR